MRGRGKRERWGKGGNEKERWGRDKRERERLEGSISNRDAKLMTIIAMEREKEKT